MLRSMSLSPLVWMISFLLSMNFVQSRPRMQTIRINGHEWTVPDEPGWGEGEKLTRFLLLLTN